ncbi:HAD family hydrolase [Caviibacter abscessus]|uniref:HAD family hydrolase n=1 Tax=Caviibacter abscessus TaxID=1766719 RepID=UPI0008340115|nr:haloacid dehalogenase-like hydrolase [Caviibacter abscessus]
MTNIIEKIKEDGAYAVFDCDETIINGDVGRITVKYQLEYDEYILTPEEIKQKLLLMYPDLEEGILNLDMKTNFIALSDKIYSKYEKDISLLLIEGMTSDEVYNLTKKSIKAYPNDLTKRIEMENLFNLLRENNIEIYICSASQKDMVNVAADIYGIPRENVRAVNLKMDNNNKYIYEETGIVTRGVGKIESIKSLGKKEHPVLIAGDSDGDYAMLNYFKIKHGMIINPKENTKVKYLVDNVTYFEYRI